MILTPNCMAFIRFLQILALCCSLSAPLAAQALIRPQPEISTGSGELSIARGQDFMIVTANPHATRAGYEILKKGGSAADAAIAAQLTLGLTEPQSSGLGGGAFILHYNAKDQKLTSYDGRETAPSLAGPFLVQQSGEAMDFMDAVVGGRAVGVPGVPALLKEFHELHGALTWMELFEDPVKLAKDGFEVSLRLSKMVTEAQPRLFQNAEATAYFLPQGQPIQPGHMLKNPAYAETLKDYAFYGSGRFYLGELAEKIVGTVQNIADNPGLLTMHDFASYEVKRRDPVCGPYRTYIVCSMGEPSSGGLTLLQILGQLEHFDLPTLGPKNPQSWHLIAGASALAFSDRGAYMADSDFVNTPGITLIDPAYLKSRAALIRKDKPLKSISPGQPPGWDGPLYKFGDDLARPGTSHISVIDKDGNIVSMTTTIEGAFGSHVMVDGFLLNNQLTDFAFTPRNESQALVANMVEPGKRPRSSMAPTIVFNQAGEPVLVIGSAGGSRIIGYVLQRIIAALDWDMGLPEALSMPHILARGPKIELEATTLAQPIESIGNKVEIRDLNSGLTAIQIDKGHFTGAADPRREGHAMGE